MQCSESHFCQKTHALLHFFGKIHVLESSLPKISRIAAIFRQPLSKTSSIAVSLSHLSSIAVSLSLTQVGHCGAQPRYFHRTVMRHQANECSDLFIIPLVRHEKKLPPGNSKLPVRQLPIFYFLFLFQSRKALTSQRFRTLTIQYFGARANQHFGPWAILGPIS